MHDVRNANGSIHFRVVGSLLRSNLANLHPCIRQTVADTFAVEMKLGTKLANGESN